MENPIQYHNTNNPSQMVGRGVATTRGGCHNNLSVRLAPPQAYHNNKCVMINPPGAYHNGGVNENFTPDVKNT